MSAEHDTAVAIGELSREQFAYGYMDCCRFAASVVRKVYGIDLLVGWNYQTKEEAEIILQAFGGLEGVLVETLGASVAPSSVGNGEPVLAQGDNGDLIVGVRYQDRAVFKSAKGVVSLNILDSRVKRGWRVSCQQR